MIYNKFYSGQLDNMVLVGRWFGIHNHTYFGLCLDYNMLFYQVRKTALRDILMRKTTKTLLISNHSPFVLFETYRC